MSRVMIPHLHSAKAVDGYQRVFAVYNEGLDIAQNGKTTPASKSQYDLKYRIVKTREGMAGDRWMRTVDCIPSRKRESLVIQHEGTVRCKVDALGNLAVVYCDPSQGDTCDNPHFFSCIPPVQILATDSVEERDWKSDYNRVLASMWSVPVRFELVPEDQLIDPMLEVGKFSNVVYHHEVCKESSSLEQSAAIHIKQRLIVDGNIIMGITLYANGNLLLTKLNKVTHFVEKKLFKRHGDKLTAITTSKEAGHPIASKYRNLEGFIPD